MQVHIAMSSAEAEYVAMAASTQEALFVHILAKEMDLNLEITLKCDASAAIAMSEEAGVGRARNLDLRLCFF